MNQHINEICKDPLFQINLAIWLAQPQPKTEYFCIYPLFYKSDLNIYSIGPLLALSPDIRLTVSKKLYCQDGARPDLILETKKTKRFCILECKASSFGPSSSTANQSRTLLLITGPILSEVLGIREQREGMLCYFTISSQIEMLQTTLKTLKKEIKEKVNLESGYYGCFGIKISRSAISLEYSEGIKNFLSLIKGSPVEIMQLAENSDPRPLYFIPYDPNIQQTKEERQLCQRILFERILSHIISEIGGADVPFKMIFTTKEILNSATFEVYEIWDDSEAKKHTRRLAREFLENIRSSVGKSLKECITYESQKGWVFNLKNKEIQKEMLKQLSKFKPETLDLSRATQFNLFDEHL